MSKIDAIFRKGKGIFTKYHLYVLILNVFSVSLFLKMIDDVVNKEFVTKIDIWINAKMVLLWNPLLNKIMTFITSIANPALLLVASMILFGILFCQKKWHNSLLLIFGLIGGSLFELITKLIVHRARPENAFLSVSGYSFPSGHATMAIIFFSLLIYSFKDDIKNTIIRCTFIIFNILLFLLIGFSRVYLNVHWFSDIVAGFALGLFWLTFLILVFRFIAYHWKKHLLLLKGP